MRRRRAVGTRDRIMTHLALAGEVTDKAGLASTVLAAQVGYPGSSIAFAQLLSGMQRSGLIEREVRGKRTYRIAAVAGASAQADAASSAKPARQAQGSQQASEQAEHGGVTARLADAGGGPRLSAPGPGDFDYDELARRLLVQVVRRLASAPGDRHPPAEPAGTALEQTVAGLEQELASVRMLHGTLTAENARLREQLRAARRSLALAQGRTSRRPLAGQWDAAESGVLERLLASSGKQEGAEDAGTG